MTLTDIRLRKMMFDSGTPLLRSRDIAFTAEFPVHALGFWNNVMKTMLGFLLQSHRMNIGNVFAVFI